MPLDLISQRGLLFRITHANNLPWLLTNGLHSANGGVADPNFTSIGNPDLIAGRAHRPVPVPGGLTLNPCSRVILSARRGIYWLCRPYKAIRRLCVVEMLSIALSGSAIRFCTLARGRFGPLAGPLTDRGSGRGYHLRHRDTGCQWRYKLAVYDYRARVVFGINHSFSILGYRTGPGLALGPELLGEGSRRTA